MGNLSWFHSDTADQARVPASVTSVPFLETVLSQSYS